MRLLPPRDPYTQQRDRDTILDQAHHRQVWQTVGEPGAVLGDGRITGTWRQHKRGDQLTIAITTFDPLRVRARQLLREEADQIAALRATGSVHVEFTTA